MGQVLDCCFCGCGTCFKCSGCATANSFIATFQCGDCNSPIGTGSASASTTICGSPNGCPTISGEVTFHVNHCNEGGPFDCDMKFSINCDPCDCGFDSNVLLPGCFLFGPCSINGADCTQVNCGAGGGNAFGSGGTCSPFMLVFVLQDIIVEDPDLTCACNRGTLILTPSP
ncbi:MAG: hypothetical protein KGL39_29320 [Patescibacteria group bacterium]|nr:hypothetical protein [Patescibacteria group bacterium]